MPGWSRVRPQLDDLVARFGGATEEPSRVENPGAVEALARLSRQHERILNAAGEGIYEIDERGRTRFVNPAAARLLGADAAALIGLPVHDVLHSGLDVDEAICPIHTALVDGVDSYVKEDLFRTRDGSRFPVEYICTPITEQDRILGAVITFQNIAERRLIETEIVRLRDMALESARLRSEFLANMSHEIRTPLNGIIGMTGILLDTDLNAEQRRSAAIIKTSADALLTIVNDILDFSRIESGKMRFETLDFDLRDVIESTTESFAEAAHAKGLELIAWVDRDVPLAVRGDPGRLRQVLTNLLGNAIKFTERGEVVLRVTRETRAADEAPIRFEVRDTGIGIAPVQQTHLFQPFVQADSSTTRIYGGTGLGLAISKQIVEQMGGTIGVESEPGRGSRFWCTLRLAQPPALAAADAAAGQPAPPRLAGIRALVVEDNPTCASLLRQLLVDDGAACVEVDHADEGVRELRRAAAAGMPYDLVLLDHGLFGLRGVALGREIQSEPTLTTRLVLLVPTTARRDVAPLTPARGVTAVPKPVKQSQLVGDLVALLATRRTRPTSSDSASGSASGDAARTGAGEPAAGHPRAAAAATGSGVRPAALQGSAPSSPSSFTGAPRGTALPGASGASGASGIDSPWAPATAPASSASSASPMLPTSLTPPAARRPRVLVAEDNIVNQQVALQQLRKLGYMADAVANGHEALEALTRIRYDLVLMDCQMPELDGYDATRELRRREGPGRHTPVIAMTAYALPSDRQHCLEAGMDDYVAKPVTLDHLKTIVNTYLREPSAADEGQPVPLPEGLVGVIDAAMWQSLHAIQSEHGGDFVQATITLYLDYAASCFETLRGALAAGDLHALARALHSLKGSSSILGLSTIANLSAELSRTARSAGPADAVRLLERLELEFQRVKTAMESQLSGSGTPGLAERRP